VILKLFHKIKRRGTALNSFHEASIALIPKLDKGMTKKQRKLQTSFFNENKCKSSE
jgi:hypothetical protein